MKLTLFHCTKCGADYRLTHTCVTSKAGPRRVRLKPRATRTCAGCGEEYTNPITHTCVIKTDYKKRLAAAKRKAKTAARAEKKRQRKQTAAARRKDAARRRKAAAKARKTAARTAPPTPRARHDYRLCYLRRDDECTLWVCRVYREGIQHGIDTCPRPHEGATA